MQFIKYVYFACTFLRISYFPRKVYFPLTSHTRYQYKQNGCHIGSLHERSSENCSKHLFHKAMRNNDNACEKKKGMARYRTSFMS